MIDARALIGPSARRRAALAFAMWVFAIATTMLLIGLWGRSVSSDEATIEESARAVVEQEMIADRVEHWVARGLASTAVADDSQVVAALADVGETPQARGAVASVVEQVVEVAFAEPGAATPIEVGEALAPLGPVVGERLRDSGIPADQSEIDAAIAEVPDLVLTSGVDQGLVGAATRARTWLTRVVAFSLLTMVLSGAAAILLAEDRLRTLRTLMVRVAVSALTFALILRLGAWALDPSGGRSPVAAGGAVLLRSNGLLLPILAAVHVGAAVAITIAVRHRRRVRMARAPREAIG